MRTYPQPCGVTTPKKQSPDVFSTTWSLKMGVMTMPALASEAASRAAATASAKGDFMAVRLAWTHTLSFRVRACVRAGFRIPLPPMRALAYTTLSLRLGQFAGFAKPGTTKRLTQREWMGKKRRRK